MSARVKSVARVGRAHHVLLDCGHTIVVPKGEYAAPRRSDAVECPHCAVDPPAQDLAWLEVIDST